MTRNGFVRLCLPIALGFVSACTFGFPFGEDSDDAPEGTSPKDPTEDLDRSFLLSVDRETLATLGKAGDAARAELPRGATPIEFRVAEDSGLKVGDLGGQKEFDFSILASKLGSFEMTLVYEASDGGRHFLVYEVEVVAVDHVEFRMSCVDFPLKIEGDQREPILVPAGSPLSFLVSAHDAAHRLLFQGTDSMVENLDEFGSTRATPTKPGTYVLDLVGPKDPEVELTVYDPDELSPFVGLDLSLNVRSDMKFGVLSDEEDVCLLPEGFRADVTVIEGDCRPYLGRLEFEDGISLSGRANKNYVQFSGSERCTVELDLHPGTSTKVEILPLITPARPRGSEQPNLGTSVVELDVFAEAETEGLAECDYDAFLDACDPDQSQDCTDDFVWVHEFWEPGNGDKLDSPRLGLGLSVELRVGARDKRSGLLDRGIYPPVALTTNVTPSDAVAMANVGCVKNFQVIDFTPQIVGEIGFDWDAYNVPEPKHTSIETHAVQLTRLRFPRLSDPIQGDIVGSTWHFFAGETYDFEMLYYDELSERLHGYGLVQASSDNEEALARLRTTERGFFRLEMGKIPHLIEVASPLTPAVHRIFVEDASAIFGIDVRSLPLAHLTWVNDEMAKDDTLRCITLKPLARDGKLIHGEIPEFPRVRGALGRFLVEGFDEKDEAVCFKPIDADDQELKWSWASAEETTRFE